MEKLNKRQILLEISEDKKYVTVELGDFPPETYMACPEEVVDSCAQALKLYFRNTGLEFIEEWSNEKCPRYDFNCRCH